MTGFHHCRHCHLFFNHPKSQFIIISSGPGELHSALKATTSAWAVWLAWGLGGREKAGLFLTGKRSAQAGFFFLYAFIHSLIHSLIEQLLSVFSIKGCCLLLIGNNSGFFFLTRCSYFCCSRIWPGVFCSPLYAVVFKLNKNRWKYIQWQILLLSLNVELWPPILTGLRINCVWLWRA